MPNSIIKLKFTHQPLYKTEQRLLDILKEKFPITLVDENPDYVIGNVFHPTDQMKYPKAVKILFIGENVVPDFNLFDYAIGMDNMQFGDRYLRVPFYCFYKEWEELLAGRTRYPSPSELGFCSMVVSNGLFADPLRQKFFEELCKYKKVDSAGKFMNNMGGGYLEDKLEFLSRYKFNIAFENSSIDGYTTEKIMEPMTVNSIPIYWGNPSVNLDFNLASFICLRSEKDIPDVIDQIKELDQNDAKYQDMLHQPWLNSDGGYSDYKERLWTFFDNIFSQPLPDARRISEFGLQPKYGRLLAEGLEYRKYEKVIKKVRKLDAKLRKIGIKLIDSSSIS